MISHQPTLTRAPSIAAALLHLLAATSGPVSTCWGWIGGGGTSPARNRCRQQRSSAGQVPLLRTTAADTPFRKSSSAARTTLSSLATPSAESSTPPFPPQSASSLPTAGKNKKVDSNDSPSHTETSEQQHGPKEEGKEEVASLGRVLEGGKVIDFSNVKASDRAEVALKRAREKLLYQRSQKIQKESGDSLGRESEENDGGVRVASVVNGDGDARSLGTDSFLSGPLSSTAASTTGILGINQEVVEQVGHDLGTFATPAEIQECAAYLRSDAPPGLLESSTPEFSSPASITATNIARHQAILAKAYFEAGEVTSAFAKTFYMGTMLLPPKAREAIWAVYVWCRRTDEIVDAPRGDRSNGDEEMLMDLSSWEMRLEDLFRYGQVVDVYDLCLLDCRIKYPTMNMVPYMDMIRGMLMDVPGIGQDRYDKFDELHLYCYRVAGTVGLMSLPIFGCARDYDDETAREPALSLGVAFQLTNILRDVGEDAVTRGRVYLPQEDLRRFDVTEEQIFERRVDENYVALMKFEIARAKMYYERARRGVFMLAPESRLPVQSSLDAYGRILDKIEANAYDSLNKRAYVDKWEKLCILPSSWYRTLDISRVLPLPGDKPVLMGRT